VGRNLGVFVASVCMVSPGSEEGVVTIEKCLVINNVCHSWEGHESNFFFMYGCFFTYSHVCLPFDKFTMGVLHVLNVAPTQLHPNS